LKKNGIIPSQTGLVPIFGRSLRTEIFQAIEAIQDEKTSLILKREEETIIIKAVETDPTLNACQIAKNSDLNPSSVISRPHGQQSSHPGRTPFP
jgi:hypothetical protein